MTPEQTKLVIDNIHHARQAAKRHSSGDRKRFFDELYSVALERLCEMALSDRHDENFGRDVYWKCHWTILDWIRGTKSGRLGGRHGHLPYLLGGLESDRADELVQWSLTTIPVSDGSKHRKGKGRTRKRCSICGEIGNKRTHGKPNHGTT